MEQETKGTSYADLDAFTTSLHSTNESASNAIEIPNVALPKGGGALKGIDEKFQVNPSNGTASFAIPFPATSGRNGFAPSLTLNYNSGSSNSILGLGWELNTLSIQRKTDKGIPKYQDTIEEDVFLISGAEDLVPYLKAQGTGQFTVLQNTVNGYTVKRYRPRTEGDFSRIEKITHATHGIYWKVTTRDNITTFFGRSASTRIANPEQPTQIYQWLPEFSYDDKGNWIQYVYKNEDVNNVPNTLYEQNRIAGKAKFANTYLKRIKYGNRKAYYANSANPYDIELPNTPEAQEHFFEVVLDYGEHRSNDILAANETPSYQEQRLWSYRKDAFSSYRSGFEIRTYRRCLGILMFHSFKDEKELLGYKANGDKIEQSFGANYLVKSLDLTYKPAIVNTNALQKIGVTAVEVIQLNTITQSGYIRKEDNTYAKKNLPPIAFTYQQLDWNITIKTIHPEAIMNTPIGVTNNYQWVDLYGEGISGILTEQANAWYYKHNLGGNEEEELKFSTSKEILSKPSYLGISNGLLSIQDLESNGEKQIVVQSEENKGYFELDAEAQWQPFVPFKQQANVNLEDANTRLIDITGDGRPDLVITEDDAFAWYASKGKEGYDALQRTLKAFDEEQGPAIIFANQEQSIFLADMTGDGLTDIIRIRNGEICYWANKGYGTFSAKITMANAPVFDVPEAFNIQYIHLADVTGTGATDILYLGQNTFTAYINLSGNAWSTGQNIDAFFPIDQNSRISVLDLLGTGTSCIVWSSDLPEHANAPMRYIDLMNSKKPHVLIHQKNNLGKEVTITYKSSTYYYLKDKKEGKPWITKLPFPVQLVSQLEVEEHITKVRFTTEYKYHHGYYDTAEREFRGFGMVEQLDSEHYEVWQRNNSSNALETSEALYQKPVLTKTWYHTGAFLNNTRILSQFKTEYWHAAYNKMFPSAPITITEPELPEAQLSEAIKASNSKTYKEALRACKGMVLRQEVFALDAPENATVAEQQLQMKPYTVSTHNCNIQLLQPQHEETHGVFLVTESEAITIHYERDETDSRITHTINTKIDNIGNVLESASIVYGRNQTNADAYFQSLTNTVTDFSEDVLNNNTTQKSQLQNAFTNNIQAAKAAQIQTQITYTKNSYASYVNSVSNAEDIDLPHAYRLRMPYEAKTYELTGFTPNTSLFIKAELENALTNATEIAYQDTPSNGQQKRLVEHSKTKYKSDNLDALAFGVFDTLGLVYENYQLACTPNLVDTLYKNNGVALKFDNETVRNIIEAKAGFVKIDGNLWIRSGRIHLKANPTEALANVKQRFFSPVIFEDALGAQTKVTYDVETFTSTQSNNDGYYLFITAITDALENKQQIDMFNYRSMSPMRAIDINGNPTTLLVDELGMVKASATEGNGSFKDATRTAVIITEAADNLFGLKAYTEASETAALNQLLGAKTFNSTNTNAMEQAGNSLLQNASVRFLYQLDNYIQTQGNPAMGIAILREDYFTKNANSAVQFNFEYSDGLGNIAMVKAQAAPGKAYFIENGIKKEKDTGAELRWVGNGRTILNNKGNTVKQYEPYYSTHFGYENDAQLVEIGVTPITHYDPLGRAIKTVMPNGTITKVQFNTWQKHMFDANDTVLESAWYDLRTNPARVSELTVLQKEPIKEKEAALASAEHANTPSAIVFDALGRPVLNLKHNGKDANAKDRLYSTCITLDIEGNTKRITDARGNTVMTCAYNMLGHRLYQNSMDTGQRWLLNNILGSTVLVWDERNHIFETVYDILSRPLQTKVKGGDGTVPLNHIIERMIYGEDTLTPNRSNESTLQQKNVLGTVTAHFDTAGVVHTAEYDFKIVPLRTTRQLFADYKNLVNWTDANLNTALEAQTYTVANTYDALGRITEQILPEGSILKPSYDKAGKLFKEQVIHANPAATTEYIKTIDYNAKGQRTKVVYGNDVSTKFSYDPLTLSLAHIESKRQNGDPIQDLYYTADALGNITHIEDKNIPVTFFNNQKVTGISKYKYDALYRLTEASGRENNAALTFGQNDNWQDTAFQNQLNTGDPVAVHKYAEHYKLDSVGNILEMHHQATGNNWKRSYNYASTNNRLQSTKIGSSTYNYSHHSTHGYITAMPHLDAIVYNCKEHIIKTIRQSVAAANGTAETTYYQYDASGNRIRKITENSASVGVLPTKKDERIYISSYEVYKKHSGTHQGLERKTINLLDGDHRFVTIETRNSVNDGTEQHLVRYQLGNHLGSSAIELDANAAVISYEEYHPYGTTAYAAKNASIKAAAKRYRYTGMERDEETGLSYHNARYYIPWLARWISPDPIGLEDGINLYQYVNGNPISFTDPTGNYGEAGHFYTIYYVSLAAGFDEETAFRNAFFAQMPDEVHELDAVSAQKDLVLATANPADGGMAVLEDAYQSTANNISEGLRHFVYYASGNTYDIGSSYHAQGDNSRLIAQLTRHRDDIQRGLHVLTGESSADERVFRASEVQRLTPGSLEFGLNLHAFGDSYAHSTINDPSTLYATGWGHAVELLNLRDGHAPDIIPNRPELYDTYVTNLYNALRQSAEAQGLDAKLTLEETQALASQVSAMRTVTTTHSVFNRLTGEVYEYERSRQVPLTEEEQIALIRQLTQTSMNVTMRAYAPETHTTSSFSSFAAQHQGVNNNTLQDAFQAARRWNNR